MGILDNAFKKSKEFLSNIKKETKKVKQKFVKDFKRKYTSTKQASNFKPGKLITFTYNAIDDTKKFDKKPLVVSLGLAKDNPKHFYGLNLHWLPENQRVLLASLVVEMLEKKKGKLDYDDVKPLMKKFEGSPILRRYAIRRVSPKIIEMPSDIYLRAASLDYAQWSQ